MDNLKTFTLQGFAFDKTQSWRRISSKIHADSPGKAAIELIQNALDASDSTVPMKNRKIKIDTTPHSFSITDWGSGFTEEKLKILLTLGATDKAFNEDKIGQWGLGYYSCFNKKLHTSKVVLITKIEQLTIKLTFTVTDPDEMPKMEIEELNETVDFSTQILVKFKTKYTSVDSFLYYAKKAAQNFPAQIVINNLSFCTIWDKAKMNKWQIFENENCHGFLKPGSYYSTKIVVYCKYERILSLPTGVLVNGHGKPNFNLKDYADFPYMPGIDCVVSCNNLNLTISRDGFYLDVAYYNMKTYIKDEIFKYMNFYIFEKNPQVALANMYIFRKEIGSFLNSGKMYTNSPEQKEVLTRLTKVRVFHVNGKRKLYSLTDLKNMLSEEVPLFYSPNKLNINYLAGNYKHDFILLCERITVESGADEFWKNLLEEIFKDIVNLDTIQNNNDLVKKLVERGIIDKKVLAPAVSFVGEKKLKSKELEFLTEISFLLNKAEVLEAIERNLFLEVKSIRPIFFEVREEGAYISTGFFDEDQKPISDDFISNFRSAKNKESQLLKSAELVLGLRKDHVLIEQLINSSDKQRAFFALTMIASEITASQKLIVPYSNFFHLKRETLSREIRNALINSLIIEAA